MIKMLPGHWRVFPRRSPVLIPSVDRAGVRITLDRLVRTGGFIPSAVRPGARAQRQILPHPDLFALDPKTQSRVICERNHGEKLANMAWPAKSNRPD